MMNSTSQGRVSVLQFTVIGVLLVVLLIAGVYFGVRRIATGNEQKQPIAVTQKESSSDKKAEETKKKQDAAAREEAEDKKKAAQEQAAKDQEKRTQSAVESAQRQSQQDSATNPTQSPATIPSEVASTGPEDMLIAVVGVAALSYTGHRFIHSRKELRTSQLR